MSDYHVKIIPGDEPTEQDVNACMKKHRCGRQRALAILLMRSSRIVVVRGHRAERRKRAERKRVKAARRATRRARE